VSSLFFAALSSSSRPPPARRWLPHHHPAPSRLTRRISPLVSATKQHVQPFAQLIPPLLVRVSPASQRAHAYHFSLYSASSAPSSLTRLLALLLCSIDLNIVHSPPYQHLLLRIIPANYLPNYPSIRITQLAHPGVHHSIHSRPLRRAFPQPLIARLVRRTRGNRPSPSSSGRLTPRFSHQYHVPAAIRSRCTQFHAL